MLRSPESQSLTNKFCFIQKNFCDILLKSPQFVFYEDFHIICFVNLTSPRNIVLINAAILRLSIVQFPHICILLFMLCILFKGVHLIEYDVIFNLNICKRSKRIPISNVLRSPQSMSFRNIICFIEKNPYHICFV